MLNHVHLTRYLAIVFWKSRREIWLHDPTVRGSRDLRTWPPLMKKACLAYPNWTKYATYGTHEDEDDCGPRVINFIRSFAENWNDYDKKSIKSIK
jgi:hypothetical protein